MGCLPRLNRLDAAKSSADYVLFRLFSARGFCFALEHCMSLRKQKNPELKGKKNIFCHVVENLILKYTENRLCDILILCGNE